MKNKTHRYLIKFTYIKDLDRSFNYDTIAKDFMTYVSSGIIITGNDSIHDNPDHYANILNDFLSQYIIVSGNKIALSGETFNITITELLGIHKNIDNIIIITDILFSSGDINLVYDGLLSNILN